jgi:predicted O-methyltransferase YrrM
VSGPRSANEVVALLTADQPAFHHDGEREQVWSARPETLAWIASAAGPDDRTLETGSGASTVVFAASGAQHTAISPMAAEHRAVERWCEQHGVATGRVEFVEGYAEEVLPGWYSERPLDLAFIDGKHSFPYPILDWHYICNSLRVGGTVLLDDVRAPAVETLCRAMLADERGWQLVASLDGEAAAFRRLAEPPPGDAWQQERLSSQAELSSALGLDVQAPPRPGIRGALRRLRR